MDQDGKLANLKQSIKSVSLVKSIGDLKVRNSYIRGDG